MIDMLIPSERQRALDVLAGMIGYTVCDSRFGHGKPGEYLDRLKPEDRRRLAALSSDDTARERPHWHR